MLELFVSSIGRGFCKYGYYFIESFSFLLVCKEYRGYIFLSFFFISFLIIKFLVFVLVDFKVWFLVIEKIIIWIRKLVFVKKENEGKFCYLRIWNFFR